MADSNDGEDDGMTAINLEVPGNDRKRYVSVDMPTEQYEELDDLKSEFGLTWRGLLMHTHRELHGVSDGLDDEKSQYDLLNATRKRHGFTWKGMLLFAARDLTDE
ncbi:hypothetical protein [Saliphagus sp. LR7]|uniref:hypothetical protein n=1 Tax=Saliphagus sp. LR7 TaxID=2282654 RepID=UPI000DF772C4|nr:hypothetical protein [Saliphagus sp. LR7]